MGGPCIHTFLTLIGSISIAEDGTGRIIGLFLPNQNLAPMEENETEALSMAAAQVNEYLSGRRTEFDLDTELEGTDFFKDVMNAISRIPYGETRTYSELADMAGHRGAYRAVGTACASNPIPIIIPCHRVVPSTGGPGSYLGGSSLKRRLLEMESGRHRADNPLDLVRVLVSHTGPLAFHPDPSASIAFLFESGGCDGDELAVVDRPSFEEHIEHIVRHA